MASPQDNPTFFCDAMLGGLSRWLRAMGYDAAYEYGIDDAELIARAQSDGRVILSSDGPLFERNVITNGQVQAVYIPQQLSKLEQLKFIAGAMHLTRRPPRCMACGGELTEVPKHSVIGEAPPLAFRNCEQFWRCTGCDKLLWHGTHWQKITHRLDEIAGPP